jgi:hypothetical protein
MVVERREAQRARSRRFAQADLLWRAPRPKRGRMATSVRVAWPTTRRLPALHSERAWLFVRMAFRGFGFGKTRARRRRENAILFHLSPLRGESVGVLRTPFLK